VSTKSIIEKTLWIKAHARALGFLNVGIAKPTFLKDDADRLKDWLNKGYQGTMGYMTNHFEKRTDPSLLVEGARSIICLSFNYYPETEMESPMPKVAKYAYGRDYHKVIKKKLKNLLLELQESIGDFAARCFTDSAPVMEREWAARSGLGWKGKNTLLINTNKGSYYFLAEIICDIKLDYNHPISDHCGTCTKCIDACPTDAIGENGYILDANKCISYLTIERKEAIPEAFREEMQDWIFGCDICQEVCPWNRFSTPHNEPDFQPKEALQSMTKRDWQEITEEVFDNLFLGSAVKRTKYEGLRRNIQFLNHE